MHCRSGRGRTGVMAACYLVYFLNLTPERAITTLRLGRPGSIETYRQVNVKAHGIAPDAQNVFICFIPNLLFYIRNNMGKCKNKLALIKFVYLNK